MKDYVFNIDEIIGSQKNVGLCKELAEAALQTMLNSLPDYSEKELDQAADD